MLRNFHPFRDEGRSGHRHDRARSTKDKVGGAANGTKLLLADSWVSPGLQAANHHQAPIARTAKNTSHLAGRGAQGQAHFNRGALAGSPLNGEFCAQHQRALTHPQ